MERAQKTAILKYLLRKIVFITGPRQAVKTLLAKGIAASFRNPAYLNYDRREDRAMILREEWPEDTDLLVLDELHKMPGWKNHLKGIFDTRREGLRILVIDGIIRTDVLDFEKVHDFKALQLVLELLRERVGAPVSYRSLARDAGVAPNTVKKYVTIFESLYIVFRVTPWAKNIARSLMKEPKIYFIDTGMVSGDEGQRLENLVAMCLYKAACVRTDLTGKRHDVHYLRTKDGLEVDFCLTEEKTAVEMIEVKTARPDIPKPLAYFHERYGIPAVLLVKELKRQRTSGGIRVKRADAYLAALEI